MENDDPDFGTRPPPALSFNIASWFKTRAGLKPRCRSKGQSQLGIPWNLQIRRAGKLLMLFKLKLKPLNPKQNLNPKLQPAAQMRRACSEHRVLGLSMRGSGKSHPTAGP